MEPEQPKPSYLREAAIAGLIFAAILFLIEVVTGMMVIYSEPAAGLFVLTLLSGAIGCLLAAFAGMFSTRMYVREHELAMSLGEGAKIGLVTGLIVAAGSTVFDLLWMAINPGFQENLMEASIEHIEAITQIPEEQKQEMIDAMYADTQHAGSFTSIMTSLFGNVIVLGLLNTLSGTLGAKFFATQPEVD